MNEQNLTDLLREHASANGVPGAAIGVVRDGVRTLAACGVCRRDNWRAGHGGESLRRRVGDEVDGRVRRCSVGRGRPAVAG